MTLIIHLRLLGGRVSCCRWRREFAWRIILSLRPSWLVGLGGVLDGAGR